MQPTLQINAQTTLGELVTFFPDITHRLNDLHIDYCCQGDRSLQSAINDAGLPADFMGEVQQAYQAFLTRTDREAPITELSNPQLIDLILQIHHQPERILWKELDELINKILLVHFHHDQVLLLQLHRNFSLLKMELEQHFAKEEKILFPAMLQAEQTPESRMAIRELIEQLESEHEVAGQLIKQIIELTQHFSPPNYACPTMKAVYAKLHQLSDDIFLHIAKENSVLFKRY